MNEKLTDAIIRAAEPAAKPYKLADAGGLYLFISPSGTKIWRIKYRFLGKERALSLGHYPKVSLAAARRERDAAKKALKAKKDPKFLWQQRQQDPVDRSFEVLAREWHKVNKRAWSERHAADVIESLERGVFPYVGLASIEDIKARDVLALLRRIEKRPAVETARRVRQRIAAVFDFAAGMDLVENNPALVVIKAMAPKVRRRQPAIVTIEEARELLEQAEAQRAHPITKLAHRFLALTVVRPGVITGALWSEFERIDPTAPIWRIPASRMKLRVQHKGDVARDHLVPLSEQAMELLAVLRGLSGRSPYLFPHVHLHHEQMSENAIGYLLNRAGYHRRHVPHGWRATFSTIMNERHPADRQVIEAILAHVPENKVAAAYNRALYLDRRRELLQEWADLLLDGQATLSAIIAGPKR
ncbi:integrase [Angulomicrobium tetraedrale]|uniref:Integrase n=1 Tax=Ancylobacter tetraedralis TaxID=217068 RepID=A0A839ZB51_9HYPH|nr:integrase arm-type DNA-binding domain-containing protein [Ancylobacter tetraedralis]MBB3772003.1 integrase [Ancylobacter tetraedralis]